MSKTATARESVARALLGTEAGEQIPTTTELAHHALVGNGTIQAALRSLEDEGIVKTTAHGKQGRRIASENLVGLWKATGRGPLTGILPLPQSREFAGLATALMSAADERGLPTQLLFRQGAAGRIDLLESERVDFIVTSAAASQNYRGRRGSIVLGPHTYYRRDAVVVVTRRGEKPGPESRVAIDRKSGDHADLTLHEFPNSGLVDTPYLYIPDSIIAGDVDVAIWHLTGTSPLLMAVGLSIHPLVRSTPEDNPDLNRASILWRAEDVAAARMIRETFVPRAIEEIQDEVIAGVRVPQF